MLDLTPLISLLSAISPQAALIGGAVVFIVQHLAAKQGANVTMGGLLGLLSRLFGNVPSTPALVPSVTQPVAPVVPTGPVNVTPVATNDPLANRPVLKAIRDSLATLAFQKMTASLAVAPDDHDAAVAVFQKVSAALKATDAQAK